MTRIKEIKIPVLALTPHGGARVLVAIANALSVNGWKVTIVTSNYKTAMPFEFDNDVVIKKLGPPSSSKALCVLLFMLFAPFYLIRSNIIANHFLTVVPAWLATTFLGARYVYLVQGVEERFFLKRSQAPLRALCRWTYRRGRLVAANKYLAAQISEYRPVLLSLNLGIARSFFAPQEKPAPEKLYDVVYFMRGQPVKRLDRFDAILDGLLTRGKRVACVSQDLELLAGYRDRVVALTPRDDAELVAILDRSRLLLLTSEHEGFALPPLEAMARGIPAVLYECGGPGVYVRDLENAFVVKDGEAGTALSCIDLLLEGGERYNYMSEQARVTANAFKLDSAVNVFVNFVNGYFNVK
jgi:glycosyltransferase involved in cell wall biosynthesis